MKKKKKKKDKSKDGGGEGKGEGGGGALALGLDDLFDASGAPAKKKRRVSGPPRPDAAFGETASGMGEGGAEGGAGTSGGAGAGGEAGGDDASDARWFPLCSLPAMAFDHKVIVRDALRKLAREEEGREGQDEELLRDMRAALRGGALRGDWDRAF